MSTPARGPLAAQPDTGDADLERQLRPRSLDDFIGQTKIKDNLRVFVTAALQRAEALDHVLLSGPPGLGKCITPDSLILTRGGWVPFAELIPEGMTAGESRPVTLDLVGVNGLEPASHVYSSGRQPTLRVRTRSGFEIEGTPHHPVLVATSEGPQWKRLDALAPEDHIAVARGARVPGTASTAAWRPDDNASRRRRMERSVRRLHRALSQTLARPPAACELRRSYATLTGGLDSPTPQLTAQRLGLPLSDGRRIQTDLGVVLADGAVAPEPPATLTLDADLAYLLGAYVGDGHMETGSNYPAFVITCAEPDMQAELSRITEACFGRTVEPYAPGYQSPRLGFSQRIGQVALDFGVEPAGAAEKSVPSAVLRGSPEIVRGFLQGLFDADGHARPDGVEFGTRSEALARQTQLLLAGLGVIAYRKGTTKADAPFWTLFIGGSDAVRFYDEIGFRIGRKQERGRALAERARGWSRSDLVPGAARLLRTLLRATGPHPRATHQAFGHVVRGDRMVSRQQAGRLLGLLPDTVADHPAAARLAALLDPRIAWDAVADVAPSESEVYDFVVPGTHSFVANGLLNHNTTLAHIISEEMGAQIKTTSGPALDKPASIAGLLTNLEEGDVLFIDEIHRLSPVIEEYLYSAMEDGAIDILIDSGPSARSVRLALPPFTLVGATTRKGLLTAPLRARFGIDFRYDYYTADVLRRIVLRSADVLGVEIDEQGAHEIARRSRGTPRIANRLLRRARDFAEVDGDGVISAALADRALNALDVDEAGLDDMDTRILLALLEKFEGGPVGVSTLAVAVSEDPGTIEEVYEPYLIQEGFMARTPRGRVAARRAYEHFDYQPPLKPGELFPFE